jgi:hypothetical protein
MKTSKSLIRPTPKIQISPTSHDTFDVSANLIHSIKHQYISNPIVCLDQLLMIEL